MFSRAFIGSVFAGIHLHDLPEAGFHRVWSDSRNVKPGDLFIAIKGDKFDGHDYVVQASQQGALGALVAKNTIERKFLPKHFILIEVDNVIESLRQLAAAYRRTLKCPIFAVAGSNGKTTTKEWLAYLLSKLGIKVYKTAKSLNSILGIALSLLQIRDEEIAVIEIGIDEPGWMDQHLEVVAPQFGLITTIGEEHLNKLKTIENVAEEELKLLKFLTKSEGAFAANMDSEWIQNQKFPQRTLRYALEKSADIEGLFEPPNFLNLFGFRWRNPLPGKHNAQNLLAALTGLSLLKPSLQLEQFKLLSENLSDFQGEAHRSQWRIYQNQIQIYDDCYNANPDSMERALAAYAEVADGCIQRVVLGDMLDLGSATEKSHHRILNLAIVLGFSEIYLVGEHFAAAFSSLINPPKNIRAYSSCDRVSETLSSEIASGDTIFLKGSRGMALEKILDHLKTENVI